MVRRTETTQRIPSFTSPADEAAFWDTHSPLDYPEEWVEEKRPLHTLGHVLGVRLDRATLEKLTDRKPMTSLTWRAPPDDLTASHDRVDLWRVALDPPAAIIDALSATLDADERNRAARYAFECDRRRFVVARGALRAILGRYLGTPPAAVPIGYGQYGKPELDRGDATPTLTFNVSHSSDLALIAVTSGRAIGIDLEEIRPDFATMDVATRFFAPAEVAALWSLPPNQRVVDFFNCWTRKEAYVKARGEGLSAPLDRFVVSLAPGEPAALLRSAADPREVDRWSLRALDLGPDYVGALAVEGSDWRLACWDAAR